MATPFRERPEFLRGREAEQQVARWLQERGWYVIPSYDYSGEDGEKAPRLQGIKAGHAVPDLDTAKSGKRVWLEVKAKASANVWRSAQPWGEPNTPEHGINYSNYLGYREVKRITGDEVWIAVYEQDTGALLVAEIDALGDPRIGNWLGTKIANWPRVKFRYMATFRRDGTTKTAAA